MKIKRFLEIYFVVVSGKGFENAALGCSCGIKRFKKCEKFNLDCEITELSKNE